MKTINTQKSIKFGINIKTTPGKRKHKKDSKIKPEIPLNSIFFIDKNSGKG